MHFCWAQGAPKLIIGTGDKKIFIWSPKGASVCQIPIERDNFEVGSLKWNPNGSSFAVEDKLGLVFAYPSPSFFDAESAC